MSDYTPITRGLRDWMEGCCYPQSDGSTLPRWDIFCESCDAIDAVHAGLEKENAALRERDGYIELPKDADGVPIHVGDMLAGEKAGGFGLCEPFEVGCILFGKDIIQVNDAHGLTRCTEFAHHYAHDTWERIIADACGGTASEQSLIARCRALCERTKGGDAE